MKTSEDMLREAYFVFTMLLSFVVGENQRTMIQEWSNVISSGGQRSSFIFSKERDGYKVFIRCLK